MYIKLNHKYWFGILYCQQRWKCWLEVWKRIIWLRKNMHWRDTRVYGLAKNVSTLKYCLTLEIVFIHFREDFVNFILELSCFNTKNALYFFIFLQMQKTKAFNSKLKSILTSEFQLWILSLFYHYLCIT